METTNNLQKTKNLEPLFIIPTIAMFVAIIFNFFSKDFFYFGDDLGSLRYVFFLARNFFRFCFVGASLRFVFKKHQGKIFLYIWATFECLITIATNLLNAQSYTVYTVRDIFLNFIPGLLFASACIVLAICVSKNSKTILLISFFIIYGLVLFFDIGYYFSLLASFRIFQLIPNIAFDIALISLPIILNVTYKSEESIAQPMPQHRVVQPVYPYQTAPQYRPVQQNGANNPNFAYLNTQPMQQASVQQVPVYAAPAQPVQPVAPQPVAPQPVQPEQTSLEKELHAIKLLLDQGILSAEEYESKQKEILEKHKF